MVATVIVIGRGQIMVKRIRGYHLHYPIRLVPKRRINQRVYHKCWLPVWQWPKYAIIYLNYKKYCIQ